MLPPTHHTALMTCRSAVGRQTSNDTKRSNSADLRQRGASIGCSVSLRSISPNHHKGRTMRHLNIVAAGFQGAIGALSLGTVHNALSVSLCCHSPATADSDHKITPISPWAKNPAGPAAHDRAHRWEGDRDLELRAVTSRSEWWANSRWPPFPAPTGALRKCKSFFFGLRSSAGPRRWVR